MATPLEHARCALVPAAALGTLADLRREGGIEVVMDGDRAWVRWADGPAGVVERLLPVPGAELFERRGAHWHRLGHALPSFDLPWNGPAEPLPLASVVVPAPIAPTPPDASPPGPAQLSLVPDDRPRPAVALACPLAALWAWAEWQPAARLATLRVAVANGEALVVGRPLPPVADGRRSWGDRVLAPLGLRPEPALPSATLLRLFDAGDDAIVILDEGGAEVVPRAAFGRLTRAGLRLALAAEGRSP